MRPGPCNRGKSCALPDIFDEVEEDLRRDRAMRLWKRHGWMAIAAAVVAVAGTAGWQAWSWQKQRTAQAATAQLLAAMRQAAGPEAAAGLESVAREGDPGLRTLARLVEAARRATVGNTQAALPLWQAVAADEAAESLYRDLAALLIVMHTLDTAPPDELAARLAPLAQPANPWRFNAAELQALLADRRGDRAAAITAFRALATDVAAPAGVRARAEQMLTVLGAGRGAAG